MIAEANILLSLLSCLAAVAVSGKFATVRILLDRDASDASRHNLIRSNGGQASCEAECRPTPQPADRGTEFPPWSLTESALCKSQTVSDAIRLARTLPVPGLPGQLAGVIIESLSSMPQCGPLFAHGPAVRDAMLRQPFHDIDLVIGNCSQKNVFAFCTARFLSTAQACHIDVDGAIVIGSRHKVQSSTMPPDSADEVTVEMMVKYADFTPNQLLYDFATDLVIDTLNGTARQHTCQQLIGLARSGELLWDSWVPDESVFAYIIAYWEMRALGFQAVSINMQAQVIQMAESHLEHDIRDGAVTFSKLYCRTVLGGVVPNPQVASCGDCQIYAHDDWKYHGLSIAQWDRTLSEDLENLWARNLSFVADQLNKQCLASIGIAELCGNKDWVYFNRSCFWTDATLSGNFFAAQETCSNIDSAAAVASVHSTEEEDFLQQIAGCNYTWIGIVQTAATNAHWGWANLDHSAADYLNWASNSPVVDPDRPSGCAFLAGSQVPNSYEWFSLQCEAYSLRYVCRKPAKVNVPLLSLPGQPTSASNGSACPARIPPCPAQWTLRNGNCYLAVVEGARRELAMGICRASDAVLKCEVGNGRYVCERPSNDPIFYVSPFGASSVEACPACEQGWIRNDGNCYYYSSGGVSQSSAALSCQLYAATLVKLESGDEASFLRSRWNEFWVGAESSISYASANAAADFRWHDNSAVLQDLWQSGYPAPDARHDACPSCSYYDWSYDGPVYKCCRLFDGKLQNHGCSGTLPFVCKKRAFMT